MLGHEELHMVDVMVVQSRGLPLLRTCVEPLVACVLLLRNGVVPLTELQLVDDVLLVSVFCVR